MDDEYDITRDIAEFMAPYVEWSTEPAPSGEWEPITEEQAQANFLEFVDRISAVAWERGYATGRFDSSGGFTHPAHNPYEEQA
jgi:hypothetical protein